MKTDELITLLAAGEGATPAHTVARRYGRALVLAVPVSALLMTVLLGINPALMAYLQQPMFWTKLGFSAVLAALGYAATVRLSRPGARVGDLLRWFALPVGLIWVLAVATLLPATPAARHELFFGETWAACPFLIALLSVPVFITVMRAMKNLAPTRLRLAGGMAGFFSGAVGATIYCIHCPELGAPFVGFWYLLGMLIPATAGALLGGRLLRW